MRDCDCVTIDKLFLTAVAIYGITVFGIAFVAYLIDRWRER